MPAIPGDLLQQISSLSLPVIAGISLFHFLCYFWLMAWARRDVRRLAHDLDSFTRDLKHRSLLDRNADLTEQVDAFLADVRDVLDHPGKTAERALLVGRVRILDEERRYLQSHSFESFYNVCRTMIEAYPLAGVLGTILAIGAALQSSSDDEVKAIGAIVRHFGDAIWSTFAGLTAGMLLMFLNSLVETRFRRLTELRSQVRETVARAKRELTFTTPGEPSP